MNASKQNRGDAHQLGSNAQKERPTPSLQATPAYAVSSMLGEGPVWDVRRSVLWWVDITPGLVHRFDPSARSDAVFEMHSPVGAVALRQNGDLLVAARDAFFSLAPDTGLVQELLRLPKESPPRRANDGKCDPLGHFLIGRMALDAELGRGTLHRLDGELNLTTLLSDLSIPNGLAWRRDGSEMYFVDSPSRTVLAIKFDPKSGALGSSRVLATFEGSPVPDGITIDTEDCLWVALWGGSRVVRLSPQGAIIGEVCVPVTQPSSCTFGNADLGTLYITTARDGLSPQELAREPLAGSLFMARPGVAGLPPVPFAG